MIVTEKQRIVLIGSVLLNVFLVAFIIGRATMMPPPPPPPPPPGAHGEMPPPPPMVGPAELFSPGEMRAEMEAMKGNFDKVRDIRKAFAAKLKAGPVSKEEVLAHFDHVDQLMAQIRDQTQEKMAEKIANLNPEQRQRFASRMERTRRSGLDGRHGPGGPRGPHGPEGETPPPPPED